MATRRAQRRRGQAVRLDVAVRGGDLRALNSVERAAGGEGAGGPHEAVLGARHGDGRAARAAGELESVHASRGDAALPRGALAL